MEPIDLTDPRCLYQFWELIDEIANTHPRTIGIEDCSHWGIEEKVAYKDSAGNEKAVQFGTYFYSDTKNCIYIWIENPDNRPTNYRKEITRLIKAEGEYFNKVLGDKPDSFTNKNYKGGIWFQLKDIYFENFTVNKVPYAEQKKILTQFFAEVMALLMQ